jgi:hypothetical protein
VSVCERASVCVCVCARVEAPRRHLASNARQFSGSSIFPSSSNASRNPSLPPSSAVYMRRNRKCSAPDLDFSGSSNNAIAAPYLNPRRIHFILAVAVVLLLAIL